MHFCTQRTQHMRLVKMVRCGDDYRVHLIGLEELLDVREDAGNSESSRESPCLWTVVVADGGQLRTSKPGERWKMRQLGDCSRTNQSDADVGAGSRFEFSHDGGENGCDCARVDARASVDPAYSRARIVCREYRPVILARARASDRTPLAHPDSVTVSAAVERQILDFSRRSGAG
jgi:hypothetical protein